MTPTLILLVDALAGALMGAVTGLTGANGMSVLVSILLLAGNRIHEVIGLCLATQIVAMSAAAVPHIQAQGVSWRIVGALCLPAALFAYLGARVALAIPAVVLTVFVIATLAILGGALIRARPEAAKPEAGDHGGARRGRQLALVGFAGVLSGFFAGLVGGGANIAVAYALHRVLGIGYRRSIAMSLCLGVVSAILGAASYLAAGRLDLLRALVIAVPALVTARLFSALSSRLPTHRIKQTQGAYLLLAAAAVLARRWG